MYHNYNLSGHGFINHFLLALNLVMLPVPTTNVLFSLCLLISLLFSLCSLITLLISFLQLSSLRYSSILT